MSEEARKELARKITKLLADLDIMFSYQRPAEAQDSWIPIAFSTEDGPVQIFLSLDENLLNVFSLSPMEEPEPSVAKTLLELNPRMAIAKVGILREKDLPLGLWVGAQIPNSEVNLESLKWAMSTVVFTTRQVRKLVKLKPGAVT